MIVIKDMKEHYQKAVSYRRGNLAQKAFYSIHHRNQYCQTIRRKRVVLSNAVKKVDTNQLMTTAFFAILFNSHNEQQRLTYIRLQLLLNKMQRVFDNFRFYTSMKKSLRQRQRKMVAHKQNVSMQVVMMKWMRSLNIELQLQRLTRQRIYDQKWVVVAVLKKQKNIQ